MNIHMCRIGTEKKKLSEEINAQSRPPDKNEKKI